MKVLRGEKRTSGEGTLPSSSPSDHGAGDIAIIDADGNRPTSRKSRSEENESEVLIASTS